MKNLIYTATLLLCSAYCGATPAYAATPAPTLVSITSEELGLCTAIGELAAVVMELRQQGGSYASMYATALQSDDESIRQVNITMIEQAFQVPRYQSDRYRSEAVADFRNQWEQGCIVEFSKPDGAKVKKDYW